MAHHQRRTLAWKLLALNLTIKGTAKMAPLSSRCPKRDPVTIEHIRALHRRLDLTNAFDIAVFAVACIAFWGCCRLGELLIDSSFDPKSHVARDMVISHGVASNGSAFINFDIPRSKTKPNGDRINLSNSTCQCSPTLAFEHHISSNTNLPSDAPLFSFETAGGSWSPLKRAWFIDRCNEIWSTEGYPTTTGHGFRIGGTTHLLLLGVDPWIVMVQGRWSSQAFLGYWRRCEEILSLFIGFSFQSREFILTTMSAFKNRLTGK